MFSIGVLFLPIKDLTLHKKGGRDNSRGMFLQFLNVFSQPWMPLVDTCLFLFNTVSNPATAKEEQKQKHSWVFLFLPVYIVDPLVLYIRFCSNMICMEPVWSSLRTPSPSGGRWGGLGWIYRYAISWMQLLISLPMNLSSPERDMRAQWEWGAI